MTSREIAFQRQQVDDAAATGRWSPKRKGALLALISAGEITAVQACERFGFSLQELDNLRGRRERMGAKGLNAQVQERAHG